MADSAHFEVVLVEKVKGPAKRASKSVRTLIASFARGSGAVGAFRGELDSTSKGLGSLTKSAGGAFAVFKGNMLTAVAGKFFELAGAAASAAAGMVTWGQNTRLAFGQLAKHGATPEELLEHSSALAKRFGLDLLDTTDQYKKFLALQFDPRQADEMIRMGADLRALGTDAEGVQGIFTALGQVKGKGKLQAEEKMQLAERGISGELIDEEIGKLLGGKSIGDVQALMQQGKVNAEVGIQGIKNAIKRKLGEENLGEAGAKFADTTIDGITGKFKAWAQVSGLKLLDKVAAPITSKLGEAFSGFSSWLDSPKGTATIDALAAGLGRAAELAGVFFDAFSGSFGETWSTIVDNSKPFFDMLAGGDGVSTVQLLAQSLGQVAAFALGTTIALGALAAGATVLAAGVWQLGVAVLDGFLEPLASAVGRVVSWWDTLTAIWNDGSKGLIEKAWDLGVNIMSGLSNGLWSMIALPVQAIANVGSKVASTLADVLGIHSPSRVTMEMGWQLGQGLAIGTERSERMVSAASADLGRSSLDLGPARASVAAPPSLDAPMGRGDITVYLTTEMHGVGGDPNEVAEASARANRREIESFFRELALEV